jgi:hypothetical protein
MAVISIIAGLLTILGAAAALVAQPSARIRADSESVVIGQSTTLTWYTQNADTVMLEGLKSQPEQVEPSGRRRVRITETRTFTLRASRGWAKALGLPEFISTGVDSKTITILHPPEVRIWAEPPEVVTGQYVTLKWEANGADTVLIEGIESGPLQVERSGSRQVKLAASKRFEIRASNQAGTNKDTVTVTARFEPKMGAEPGDVEVGGITTLSWQAEGADRVEIVGLGQFGPSGSHQVQVSQPTTFELIATSTEAGTKRASVTVTTHAPRLVFLGTQNVAAEVDHGIRSTVESFFRARGYDIVASPSQSPLTLESYAGSTNQITPIADYAVTGAGTLEWKRGETGIRKLPIPVGPITINRETIETTVTLYLARVRDHSQLSSTTGQGRKSSTNVQTQFGGTSGEAAKTRLAIEAATEATRQALTQLAQQMLQ